MKKIIYILLVLLNLAGCDSNETGKTIKFATCADYPPFEYYDHGKIIGFDVELAKLIAKKMSKEAVFSDMSFGAILASLQNGSVDAAISAMSASEERKINFDFSSIYYSESMALVYRNDDPVVSKSELSNKKISSQLGSLPEKWLKESGIPGLKIVSMDNMNQSIEALKAGQVDCVFMEAITAKAFVEKNPELSQIVLLKSLDFSDGFAIALPKRSKLKNQINAVLKDIESTGNLQFLKEKWGLNE